MPVILLIAIAATIYFRPLEESVTNSPTTTPNSTTINIDPTSSKDLINSYSIKVPEGFVIENDGQYSRKIMRDTNAIGVGPSSFVYISVVPANKQNESGTIYNYNQNDFVKLVRSQPGASIILGDSPDKDLNSYFTYTHSESKMVGGYGAKSFINQKPWEFPSGTTEYRYIIETIKANYIIGGYLLNDTTSPYYLSMQQFEEILSNIQLTPDTVTLTDMKPVTDGETKTFRDTQNGLTFTYPSDWEVRKDSQNFPEKDLFGLIKIGVTQRPYTEMYDGAMFSVMIPISAPVNLNAWIIERYGATSEAAPADDKPVFSKYSANNINYEVIRTCGLGCFDYYHTIQNGKLYGYMLKADGPQEKEYREALLNILNSATYL